MKHLDSEILRLARTRRGPYLAALSAPQDRQPGLLALLAFDAELARIPQLVSEPMLGRIRLQWWVDVLPQMAGNAHPVVRALAPLGLDGAALQSMVEAHQFALDDTTASVADHVAFAQASGGALAALMVQALGVADTLAHTAARDVGTAWALTETLNSGRRVASNEDAAAIRDHAHALIDQARAHKVPGAQRRAALPVLLVARLVKRRLDNPHTPLGAGAVLSVWWGSVVGRY